MTTFTGVLPLNKNYSEVIAQIGFFMLSQLANWWLCLLTKFKSQISKIAQASELTTTNSINK